MNERNSERMMIYQKHLFKLVPNSISQFPKVRNLKNEKNYSEIMIFFASLSSSSWQQLMTKSETHLGFKPLKSQ